MVEVRLWSLTCESVVLKKQRLVAKKEGQQPSGKTRVEVKKASNLWHKVSWVRNREWVWAIGQLQWRQMAWERFWLLGGVWEKEVMRLSCKQ